MLVIIPLNAEAVTGYVDRWDSTNGVPKLVPNISSSCNNQAEIIYMSTNGVATQVFDTTATCNSAGTPTPSKKQDIIWFD